MACKFMCRMLIMHNQSASIFLFRMQVFCVNWGLIELWSTERGLGAIGGGVKGNDDLVS